MTLNEMDQIPADRSEFDHMRKSIDTCNGYMDKDVGRRKGGNGLSRIICLYFRTVSHKRLTNIINVSK